MLEGFLKCPSDMTDEELKEEYRAIFSQQNTDLIRSNKLPKEVRKMFKDHALSVELEYILRNVID